MATSTNQTGYKATVSFGSYAGASLTNVSLTRSGEVIDLSSLGSKMVENALGLRDWELSADRNVATEAFVKLMSSTNLWTTDAATSVLVTLTNPAGTDVFKGTGYITGATLNYPMGAAKETIKITATGRYTSVLK